MRVAEAEARAEPDLVERALDAPVGLAAPGRARGSRAARPARGPPCGAGAASRTGPGRPSGRARANARSRCGPWVRPADGDPPARRRDQAAIARSTVVFPEPDSPTRPNASPSATRKETSRTAWTAPSARRGRRPREGPRPRGSRSAGTTGSRAGLVPPRRVALEHRQLGDRPVDPRQRAEEPLRVGVARGREVLRPRQVSTIRPAYMTSTRSQNEATRLRSWLMKMSPMPRSVTRSSRIASTCSCTVTSSAEVGSSAIRRSGPPASIIAIMTRWPMPPETSCGIGAVDALGIRGSARPPASRARAGAPRARTRPSARASVSATWSPTGITGFSENFGSCSTIAIRRPRISPHRGLAGGQEVDAVEREPPRGHAPRRRHQAQDGAPGHRLAGARLADDAELLAARPRSSRRARPRPRPTRPGKRTRRSSTRQDRASSPGLIRPSGRARRGGRRRAG